MTTPNLTDAERDAREAEAVAEAYPANAMPDVARLPRWKRLEALCHAPLAGWSEADNEAVARLRDAAPWTHDREASVTVNIHDVRALLRVAGQSEYRYALAEEYRIERDKTRKVLASRDTAWRAAIEGMRKAEVEPEETMVTELDDNGDAFAYSACVVCNAQVYDCTCKHDAKHWNAALSALADRMGAE